MKSLVKPVEPLEEELNKWWEAYPKLPAVLFTVENSGRIQLMPSPYRERYADNGVSIEQSAPGWTIIGYTLDPPFKSTLFDSVAIMLECNGEQVWWHFCQN